MLQRLEYWGSPIGVPLALRADTDLFDRHQACGPEICANTIRKLLQDPITPDPRLSQRVFEGCCFPNESLKAVASFENTLKG